MDWIGFNLIGMDWIFELISIRLDWIVLDQQQVGSDGIRSDQIELDHQIGSTASDQIGSHHLGLEQQIESDQI